MEFNQELAIRASDSLSACCAIRCRWRLSAYAAKTADLTGELATLHRRSVPAHLVLADHDSIVPAGRLRTAPSASTRVVAGNHGWMLRQPGRVRRHCRSAPLRRLTAFSSSPPAGGAGEDDDLAQPTLHNVHYRSSTRGIAVQDRVGFAGPVQ